MIAIGVIGCGHWGPNHIRNFAALPEVSVPVAADPDAASRDRVRKAFPGVQVGEDHREMLRDERIQAVVVATPSSTHHALVKEALQSGKDVLCEKPLATTAAAAAELAELARARGRILMVGHTFLFNPGIVKLKSLLDDQVAGKLYYMHAERTNLGPIRGDVNVVHDLASHDVSIFNYLRGSLPETVSARGGTFLRPGIEDVAFITFQYPGNVLASLLVSWLHPRKVREVTVVGDRKMIVWNDLGPMGPLMIFDKGVARELGYMDFGEFHLRAREGDITIPRVSLAEPLRLQAEHFVSCMRERSQPRTPAEQGVDVARVLDAVGRSMARSGEACAVERG
jgi:predicted dehydrogenase